MHRHSCNVKVVGYVTVVNVELEVSHSDLVVLTVHCVKQSKCADKRFFIGNSIVYNVLAELQAYYASEAEA